METLIGEQIMYTRGIGGHLPKEHVLFQVCFVFLVLNLALLLGELPIVLNQFVMWWLWVL